MRKTKQTYRVEPKRPQLMDRPSKMIEKEERFELNRTDSLASFMKQIPLEHHDSVQVEYDYSYYGHGESGSSAVYLTWKVMLPNPGYEKALARWERAKKKYDEEMLVWEPLHKEWSEWFAEYERVRMEEDRQKKIKQLRKDLQKLEKS